MPKLANERYEKFARGIAQGESQSSAYTAAGFKSTGKAAEAAASRLLSSAKSGALIAARVDELRDALAVRADVTQDSLLDELDAAVELARAVENPAAMVSAILGKAKITGHIVAERKNQRSPLEEASDEEIERKLKHLRGEYEQGRADAASVTH